MGTEKKTSNIAAIFRYLYSGALQTGMRAGRTMYLLRRSRETPRGFRKKALNLTQGCDRFSSALLIVFSTTNGNSACYLPGITESFFFVSLFFSEGYLTTFFFTPRKRRLVVRCYWQPTSLLLWKKSAAAKTMAPYLCDLSAPFEVSRAGSMGASSRFCGFACSCGEGEGAGRTHSITCLSRSTVDLATLLETEEHRS